MLIGLTAGAYNIKLSKVVSSTLAIEQLKSVSLSNWPYNIAQSREERDLMKDYYKEVGDYTNSEMMMEVPTEFPMAGAYSYIFMGLGIKLGKLLHLSFTAVYTMGRLFSIWDLHI